MAVKYKVIERSQPGVVGGGDKKYYANATSNGELTLEKLTKRIEKNSTVGGGRYSSGFVFIGRNNARRP